MYKFWLCFGTLTSADKSHLSVENRGACLAHQTKEQTYMAPGLCSPRWWLNSVLQGESFRPLHQNHLSVSAEDYVKSVSAPFDDRHWRKGGWLEILSLPTVAFIKHFVNRCHNTTFHCSCTKGSRGPRTIEPCSRNSSGSSVER